MRRAAPAFACMAAVILAASCTVYSFKEMDGTALAAKSSRAKVIRVETKTDSFQFTEKELGTVVAGGIAGSIRGHLAIDPCDIAEVTTARKRAHVLMRDGTRFIVLSSRLSQGVLDCEALQNIWVPLGEVVRAEVRMVNAAATALSTIGGVMLFAAALAIDAALFDPAEEEPSLDEQLIESMIYSLFATDGPPAPRRSIRALRDLEGSSNPAEETEFWVMEWTPVDPLPEADGKYFVRLENLSNAPRRVDEAKLVVVDHPPGLAVAPDSSGSLHAYSDPVPPASARDRGGRDIASLIGSKDDSFWRGSEGAPAPGGRTDLRDAIGIEFPRPAGARRAKLIVNAANTMWRAQFARTVMERGAAPGTGSGPDAVYRNAEFHKLGVGLETVFGRQTGQVLFAAGPLPAWDMIYGLDLGDVCGDMVRIKLDPPAGYWLIDRLAIDYGEDAPFEALLIDVEDAGVEADEEIDPGEILQSLDAEDGTALSLGEPGSHVVLTFESPPLREGMERTVFLRTVSGYETPPRAEASAASSRR